MGGPLLGGVAGRLAGVGRFLERFYTPTDLEQARRMSYADLADEALGVKLAE